MSKRSRDASSGLPQVLLRLWLTLMPTPLCAASLNFALPPLAPAAALSGWDTALRDHAAELRQFRTCDASASCTSSMRAVQTLLTRARALDAERRVRLVNHFVNRRRYRVDGPYHKALDGGGSVQLRSAWRSLLGFLDQGGDCEDYATAKYFLLRELALPAEAMRVAVLHDRMAHGHHAVLAVTLPNGAVWYLDTDDNVYKGSYPGYRFRYALNEAYIWDYSEPGNRRVSP
ncbi:MAG: transglutaminase-like cysteine peptidase [Pseudomonadales bacterium]